MADLINTAAQRAQDVRSLYLEVLGREPDPGAINWVRSTLSYDAIRQGLLDSPEGQARARSMAGRTWLVLGGAALAVWFLMRRR